MKPRIKTSIIHLTDPTILKQIVAESNTKVEVLQKLGYTARGGKFTVLSKRLVELGIDTSHFKQPTKVENVFASDTISKRTVKRALMKHKPHVCGICSQGTTWNNKPLILQMDHIDGNSSNNDIENLRLLCPNCHTQTDTFGMRNFKSSKTVEQKLTAKLEIEKRRQEAYQHHKDVVLSANIDYGKSGWGVELGKLFNTSAYAAMKWVKRNMVDFYTQNCFRHKR